MVGGEITIVATFKEVTVDGERRGEIKDLYENEFEESDTTVDAFVQFPALRAKSQYTQEVAPLAGAHN